MSVCVGWLATSVCLQDLGGPGSTGRNPQCLSPVDSDVE